MSARIFSCTQCGKCCTGPASEYRVAASEQDQLRLAKHLNLRRREFRRRYVIAAREGDELRMVRERCVFLGADNRCNVYAVRPARCASYPFWPELRSDRAWRREARRCEGITL